MDELIKKLASDKETQKKFIEFAHTREGEIKEFTNKVYDELNKFVMDSIREYALQNNMELIDDPDIQKKTSAICKSRAEDFEKHLMTMFAKSFE